MYIILYSVVFTIPITVLGCPLVPMVGIMNNNRYKEGNKLLLVSSVNCYIYNSGVLLLQIIYLLHAL
jgi:hypothetical protein